MAKLERVEISWAIREPSGEFMPFSMTRDAEDKDVWYELTLSHIKPDGVVVVEATSDSVRVPVRVPRGSEVVSVATCWVDGGR